MCDIPEENKSVTTYGDRTVLSDARAIRLGTKMDFYNTTKE